jgi:hypothetical protein
LLYPVDRTRRALFLHFLHDQNFYNRRTTRVRLRLQYQTLFDVAEGDSPADAILDQLIDLPIGSHARAVYVIANIMLPSMIGIRGNEPSDVVSDFLTALGSIIMTDMA